ncbi:MAG TPA: Chromate resistance protein ChrB [Chloroflexota bacterium]
MRSRLGVRSSSSSACFRDAHGVYEWLAYHADRPPVTLPEQPATSGGLRDLARRIQEMDGEASLVEHGQLDTDRAAALREQFQAARAEEYAEISREAELLLAHIARQPESSYAAVQALLEGCERALLTFLDQASEEAEVGR